MDSIALGLNDKKKGVRQRFGWGWRISTVKVLELRYF